MNWVTLLKEEDVVMVKKVASALAKIRQTGIPMADVPAVLQALKKEDNALFRWMDEHQDLAGNVFRLSSTDDVEKWAPGKDKKAAEFVDPDSAEMEEPDAKKAKPAQTPKATTKSKRASRTKRS